MNNRRKNVIIRVVLLIIVIILIVIISVYLGNQDFRLWADKNVFHKDIEDAKLPTIYLETEEKTHIYAYSNNIVTLEDNNLIIYNKYGKKTDSINIQVSNPKFVSKGNYLLIADEGASKLYLIYNNSLQWEKDIEGQISQITVNKSGAVGVIVTGTTYKSVIIMYDITGKEIFKTFLSSTNATDLAISDDGNYMSFIEISTAGTTISSKVKTISVDKAINEPSESIINTYETDSDVLLIKIKYKRNKVVAFADNGVYVLNNNNKEKVLNIDNTIEFVDINLNGYIAAIKEEFNKYELNLVNIENNNTNTYIINDAIKNIYCNEDVTAIDVGNKVEFVSNGAWLIKKFTSSQNIKEIILGNKIAAIIYKDRIEILDL